MANFRPQSVGALRDALQHVPAHAPVHVHVSIPAARVMYRAPLLSVHTMPEAVELGGAIPPTERPDSSGSDDESAELVMPFLPVASRGGPFDDHAYSAGYDMGLVDALLGDNLAFGRQTRMILAENREQADLLAMRHGWRATFYEHDDPTWIGVEFVRITREDRPAPT